MNFELSVVRREHKLWKFFPISLFWNSALGDHQNFKFKAIGA